jgi:hypothetical protein
MSELCLLVSYKLDRNRNSKHFRQKGSFIFCSTAFLSRFAVGVDLSTNLTWAVPTVGESHERGLGQGRYVVQNQLALQNFEKTGTYFYIIISLNCILEAYGVSLWIARYKYTFRNKAIYRSDMTNLIKSKLSDIALTNTKANLERSSSMTTLRFDNEAWILHDPVQADNISFALLFTQSSGADSKKGLIRSFQNVTDGRSMTTIPFYDVDAIWGRTVGDNLKQQLDNLNSDNEAPAAIAFTLDQKVSRNAIALWKLAGFFRTAETLNS